ncbi:MAG: hypothetical protein HOC79_07940 [Euryarchaeota archaeon]|jgi:hypothetical protein|nr:hypothetical protein [Euryarchaeota archaeon]
MWDYWFEAITLFMLFGISGRIWFLARHLDEVHDCLHNFEERAFNTDDEVRVHEGSNLRVLGLEEFMDEFGFDPRKEETPSTEKKANSSEIDAWDNS